MTDIGQKALALWDEVKEENNLSPDFYIGVEAIGRAIKQHETYKQEVSDECAWILANSATRTIREHLSRFITPKPKPKPDPDPLVELVNELDWHESYANDIRAALEARGLEIKEKG